ncbi:PREDICTED: uncharacterized protein LOC104588660 isoform X2 [Nelumbo nucifera]|uniref:Uncharacterized protein LOC104588660 isoform X2 n=1 Tax=Nelumbo nucifera TaxID=4432 RepID=A0A1U7YWV8_NELNU|nr:PREDICTED: uncharacterized protein LOC104588660 isoform X2 [Nelumbo nucifera]
MSGNPTTNEDPSENLDLNSDAAQLEEQDKSSSIRVTESTVTVSASVIETLTEDHSKGDGQTGDPPPEGESDELGARGEGENLVEPLLRASEIHPEGTNSHGAEEDVKEAAPPVVLLKETITETTVQEIQVETLAEEPSDGHVPVEDSPSEGEFNGHGVCGEGGNAQSLTLGSDVYVDGKVIHGVDGNSNEEVGNAGSVKEDVEREMKTVTAGRGSSGKDGINSYQEEDGNCCASDAEVGKMESTVEQIQVVDGGAEAVVQNPDYLEPKDNDLGRNPSLEVEGCREEKIAGDADPLVSVQSFMSADDNRALTGGSPGNCKESSSMQDHIQDTVGQAAPNRFPEVGGSQAAISDASLHDTAEADFDQFTEPAEPLPEGNLEAEAGVADARDFSHEDQTVCPPLSEQGTHVVENQAMEVEVETQAVICSGNQVENQNVEIARQSTGVEQQEKMEKTAPNQEGLNHGNASFEDYCNSHDLPPEEDSVFAVSDASLPDKVETDFDQVTEPGEPLSEGNQESEARVADICGSTYEDQSVCPHFSDQGHVLENQAMEVEVETQAVGCSGSQVENEKIDIAGQGTGAEQQEKMEVTAPNQEGLNHESISIEDSHTAYDLPPEEDSVFAISDASLHDKVEADFDQVIEPLPEGSLGAEAGVASVCSSTHEDQSVCPPLSEQETHAVENHAMEVEVETQAVGCSGNQDENKKIEIAGQGTCVEQQEKMEEAAPNKEGLNHGNTSDEDNCTAYDLPLEEDSVFAVSNLVWGKVKSHPWWPGQIFDSSDSSEKALKYRKKDSFLVAYFGDQTFAWNEASLLKHFGTHFSEMEKQNNSVAFRTAVNSALDEVSRRVELGMSCSCTSEEVYTKIKSQIIENAGIREESSKRDGVDRSLSVSSFQSQKLVEYIRALARSPSGGTDRLELVIAKAQLLALCRLKGYTRLPEFQFCGRLLENDTELLLAEERNYSEEVAQHLTPVNLNDQENVPSGKGKLSGRGSSSRKRRSISQESSYPRKKERSLSELMDEKEASSNVVNGDESDRKSASKVLSSGKKRKSDSIPEDSKVENGKRNLSSPGAADAETPNHKQSFKVGDCIRRVASKLTGSPPILKCSSQSLRKSAAKVGRNSEKSEGIGTDVSHTHEVSKKGGMTECSSPDYRNSIIVYKRGSGKHKKSLEKVNSGKTEDVNKEPPTSDADSAEAFDFDEDVKDSYWTDRIVHISSEEQLSKKGRRRKGETQLESLTKNDMLIAESESSLQLSPILDPKQQNSDGFYELAMEKPVGIVEVKYEEEFSPTALILNFAEVDSVPSEMNLNKIFKRFGPLKELETEVLKETNSAKVVFKRRADAEVACSSAGKFSIFGSAFVSYQLRYLSSPPPKMPGSATIQGRRAAISTDGN